MRTSSIHIMALACAMFLGFGCNNYTSEAEFETPELGYVFFSADANSRVTLTTGTTLPNFGVLGYSYENKWSSESDKAKPNAFPNATDKYNQMVTFSDPLYTYTPLIQWEADLRYTFFGYHPYSTGFPNVTPKNVALSAFDCSGIPYIDYTVHSWTSQEGMVDIMTAASDKDYPKQGKDAVDLVFKHRLCGLQVKARNFNETAEYIRNVSIEINNLKYDQIRIFLDPEVDPVLPAATNHIGNYVLTDKVYESNTTGAIALPDFATGNAASVAATDEANKLLLIPQTGGITGRINFDLWNGTGWDNGKYQDFSTTRTLEEGHFYTLLLSFIDDAISVTFVDSDQWDEKDVEYEFE